MSARRNNIFSIAADAPFLDRLATGLWQQYAGDGLALSRCLILLPTRRSCRHLGAAFAVCAGGKAALLPRMRPIGDSDEDEMLFDPAFDFALPPAIAPLKRQMLLTRLVRQRDPALSWDQAALAAAALARFLDQAQNEQCDMAQLPQLVVGQELAEHWQQIVEFLDLATKNWPPILAEQGCLDPVERRHALLAALAAQWRQNPPHFPIIAAGSTASLPAIADLLAVIAELPQGTVVLPGLDRVLDKDAWDKIEESHPQFSMKRWLEKAGVERNQVTDWPDSSSFSSPLPQATRSRLLSEVMRPAASTEAWRELRGQLGAETVTGLSRITCDHPQEEAQVIALRLRAQLEQGRSAALVTADRALAMRVTVLLRRWGIVIDDSGGRAAAQTALGAYLNLALAAAAPQAGAIDVLALLKHPLAACGMSAPECRAKARAAELRLRRDEVEDFAFVRQILQPFSIEWDTPLPLTIRIAQHIELAEAIATSDRQTGAARLWRGETGHDIADWLDEWRQASEDFPDVTGADYAALFDMLSATKILRSGRAAHPQLNILGPLEARLLSADLIIIGGMNEGVWPPDAGFDPWMSRPMRKNFKLPSPEFRIGIAAHDFAQLAGAPQVMMTRALRVDGTPTVPSRFLLQLETVLLAAGLSDDSHDALAPVEDWRVWAHALDAPRREDIKVCDRPKPRPDLAVRPQSLSVTEIGIWLRNPYAIYAKHILKLRKLEELDAEPDASDRGTLIHAAVEKFCRAYPDDLPADALQELLAIGRQVFATLTIPLRAQIFWWARFVDSAAWFISEERLRRETGMRLLAVEAKGRISIDGLTLTGIADRIDRLADGNLAITDYKTGYAPGKTIVESGLEPQLPLLAMIAAAGGFDAIAASEVGLLEYWQLRGAGRDEAISFKDKIAELVSEATQGLKNLIAAFADPASVYEAVPKARFSPKYNDYAHLSRLAEWGRMGDDG